MPTERPFCDVSWLAVPGDIDDALLDAVGLSDPRAVSWDGGVSAVLKEYWDIDEADAESSRVFAFTVEPERFVHEGPHRTSARRRWSCFLGRCFGDTGNDARVSETCALASRLRGEAHAFTTQGRMDWYAWTAARDGEIVRRVVYDGTFIVDQGARSPEEDWETGRFLEDTVCRIGTRYAIGPDELRDGRPDGILLATRWTGAKASTVPSQGA